VCADPALWLYLPFECPDSVAALADLLARTNAGEAPHYQTFVILDPEGSQPLGIASFMRVDPAHGSLEVGFVVYGPQLQRTVAATEAQALLAAHVFDDLGYRRYEWKCNALNAASRRAAERLGFQFEGVFRNAGVVKGRSRDTAWYALTDADWPSVRAAFAAWLAPENIGPDGVARQPLTALRSR
jgi:RimJ/RimL family protein N-acetyltransferase